MDFEVIQTGSAGNAVFYHNCILVDAGVSYAKIKHIAHDIRIVLLTHEHSDHINIKTLKTLQLNHPSVRIGCCEWMIEHLEGIENIDVFEIGKKYLYGVFEISPITLYHDVKNCGYRIFKESHRTIHMTDTQHLEGIKAIGYDAYFIEQNYDEERIKEKIEAKQLRGEFCYEIGAINGHLSIEQAHSWLFENNTKNGLIVALHQSSRNS